MQQKKSKKITLADLRQYKDERRKISMLTCYDYSFAALINASDIDLILVGDSGVMTLLGYPDTTHATVEMMEMMVKAVSFGAQDKFIVADMPFLSHRKGIVHALEAVDRLIKAGANAVKIEGFTGHESVISHIVESGVPVMGHIGLTPQSVHSMGYKVQGQNSDAAARLKQQAIDLQKSGCFAVVLECVPQDLAAEITAVIEIPVIGIGAGSYVDGQVLVLQDMLGMNKDLKPKFVRHFFAGSKAFVEAFNRYHHSVLEHSYPNDDESYDVKSSREKINAGIS
ncbi:MAG: 3-methyl-2-oxobutanoate hydroxymethyltransferase [Francisellaceae bacterium]